ncbi:uncharacterized protein LOC135688491 isoform X2 [Rhopilema esculentum]
MRNTKFSLTVCSFAVSAILYFAYYIAVRTHRFESTRKAGKASISVASPWHGIPEFILYVRFTSDDRWDKEYQYILVRTMKLFFPSERAKLVVVLDGEKTEDHYLAENIRNEWPFPKICFSEKGDETIYHNMGKSRMFWDMLHPEKCTDSPFVGFIDTDTFFSTLVTPSLLFENGKPVIVAKIGKPAIECWSLATEIFLGRKEVLQCMSTFPIMIKNDHIQKMRERLSLEHEKTFDALFRDVPIEAGGAFCISQFNIMCNYVWYYHRNEYAWHLQVIPKGVLKRKDLVPSMAKLKYYRKELKSFLRVPIPRPAIHIRYLMLNGIKFEQQEPPREVMDGFIRESLCYSAGFRYCEKSCTMYQRENIHKNLFAFEFHDWLWDRRCFHEQEKHYLRVQKFLEYSISNKKEIFGIKSIGDLCLLIEANEPYFA